MFTEPDGKKGSAKIYIRSLDNVHAAMKGCRIIDRFGFNSTNKARGEKAQKIVTSEYIEWEYNLKSSC